MANRSRKSRKEEMFRARFTSAADAKAAVETLDTKYDLVLDRRGRTIEVPESERSRFTKAVKKLEWREVMPRGRPPKTAAKKPRRPADEAPIKSTKKRTFVILTPATRDAKKLAKELDAKNDGARVIIKGSDAKLVKAAARKAANGLSMPIKLESGFKDDEPAPKAKAAKRTKVTGRNLGKLLPDLDGEPGGASRRPKSKKIKRKSERTKPVWRLDVKSSTIAKAWYNPESKRLTIEFLNGGKYRYEKVSVKEFTEFTLAESQGSWFSENIKGSKEFTKLSGK